MFYFYFISSRTNLYIFTVSTGFIFGEIWHFNHFSLTLKTEKLAEKYPHIAKKMVFLSETYKHNKGHISE